MSWPLIVALYLTAWCICVFFVLPIGIRTENESVQGHAESAPENANLKIKFIVTTLLALIITCGIVGLKNSGWVSFSD